jgi:hypothetical protein
LTIGNFPKKKILLNKEYPLILLVKIGDWCRKTKKTTLGHYENGQIKFKANYKDGKLTGGKNEL